MYKGLIDTLAFTYSFICKGREVMSLEERKALSKGAHTLTQAAPRVLAGEDEIQKVEDKKDYAQALKMTEDIEGMVVFIQSLEIV